jgi:multiple sugar transport system permease protein
MLNPEWGVINTLIFKLTGLDGPNWLNDPALALSFSMLMHIWKSLPFWTLILVAARLAIPKEQYEAAAVDGATTWQRFRTITLPQLRPVIVAITTLDLIWNFNSFGLVYVLTLGGPGHATELPMLFAYNEAFKYGEFGYAAALGDAMVIVIACILVFTIRGRLKEAT